MGTNYGLDMDPSSTTSAIEEGERVVVVTPNPFEMKHQIENEIFVKQEAVDFDAIASNGETSSFGEENAYPNEVLVKQEDDVSDVINEESLNSNGGTAFHNESEEIKTEEISIGEQSPCVSDVGNCKDELEVEIKKEEVTVEVDLPFIKDTVVGDAEFKVNAESIVAESFEEADSAEECSVASGVDCLEEVVRRGNRFFDASIAQTSEWTPYLNCESPEVPLQCQGQAYRHAVENVVPHASVQFRDEYRELGMNAKAFRHSTSSLKAKGGGRGRTQKGKCSRGSSTGGDLAAGRTVPQDEGVEKLLPGGKVYMLMGDESELRRMRIAKKKKTEKMATLVFKGDGVTCHHCGEWESTKDDMETHIQEMHSFRCRTAVEEDRTKDDYTDRKHVCDICDKRFAHNSILVRHKLTHTGQKPYVCPFCNFGFSQNANLKTHILVHTGEKRFKCTVCDYRCSRNESLKIHMRVHTGERPFVCSICDYKCVNNGNLKKHMLVHTGEKMFRCAVCDLRCTDTGQLKVHMRTHRAEKPYKCSLCEYRCAQNGTLKRHMLTHTGDKPYKCPMCDLRCTHNGQLKVHLRMHSGEKPFRCEQCDYRGTQSGDLKRHMKVHES